MGNDLSTDLTMESCTKFDHEQMRRLQSAFKRLDMDGNGSLDTEEILQIPQLADNLLVHRVIDVIDTDKDGKVDFKEFIKAISLFTHQGDKTAKLRFTFDIYDLDHDNYISNEDLFQSLSKMVGSNLTIEQLHQIVDKTFLYADKDQDGRISFEEFREIVEKMDVEKTLPNVDV